MTIYDMKDERENVNKEEIQITASELEALKEKAAKADEHWDRILRINADFDNAKKRLEKRSEDTAKYAIEKLLLEILPVVDDLDRAIKSLDEAGIPKSVREGLALVQDKFHKILEQNGVQAIPAAGQPFDPHMHEAVGEVATDAFEEGAVAEELQKGYTLNGKLARPSRVRIARRPN